MIDLARVDRIVRQLPSEDAAWLSTILEPGWRQRERRLAVRDTVGVAAAAEMGEGARTRQAKALSRALTRYLASGWARDRQAGCPTPRNHALYRVLVANGGRALG